MSSSSIPVFPGSELTTSATRRCLVCVATRLRFSVPLSVAVLEQACDGVRATQHMRCLTSRIRVLPLSRSERQLVFRRHWRIVRFCSPCLCTQVTTPPRRWTSNSALKWAANPYEQVGVQAAKRRQHADPRKVGELRRRGEPDVENHFGVAGWAIHLVSADSQWQTVFDWAEAFQTIAKNALKQGDEDSEIYLPEGITIGAKEEKKSGCC
jgi:hypothetical protein